MVYIGNAFSLQMVQSSCTAQIHEVCAGGAKEEIAYNVLKGTAQFCIGHADTARITAKYLNDTQAGCVAGNRLDEVKFTEEQLFHRVNVNLVPGDVLYVLQVVGGRLPEGCTELPEGVQLRWKKVAISD